MVKSRFFLELYPSIEKKNTTGVLNLYDNKTVRYRTLFYYSTTTFVSV